MPETRPSHGCLGPALIVCPLLFIMVSPGLVLLFVALIPRHGDGFGELGEAFYTTLGLDVVAAVIMVIGIGVVAKDAVRDRRARREADAGPAVRYDGGDGPSS